MPPLLAPRDGTIIVVSLQSCSYGLWAVTARGPCVVTGCVVVACCAVSCSRQYVELQRQRDEAEHKLLQDKHAVEKRREAMEWAPPTPRDE